MRNTYTDQRVLASSTAVKHAQIAAEPAQQCAACVYSFKGNFEDDLTREGLLKRAADGALQCLLEMPLPAAGRCPAYREIAADGGILGELEVLQ